MGACVWLRNPGQGYCCGHRHYLKTIIILRQLASHTSGLQRGPDMPGADLGPVDQWESKLLSCIPYTSFNSNPGTLFQYSNIGYALLGLTLERASGIPYIQMVRQRIFTPLHIGRIHHTLWRNLFNVH